MVTLAPNVYVLEYLMNTNQLSGANEESAYRFIQSGNFSTVSLNESRRFTGSSIHFRGAVA